MRNFFNLTIIYVSVLTLVFSQTMPAYAGLIGTEQFMANQIADQDRQTLHNVLERDDARKLLEKHGVSTEQAQERIDAMTNEEVRIMAQKFDSLPTAGDGGILLAVLVVILVFVILDLAGVTDIFKSI